MLRIAARSRWTSCHQPKELSIVRKHLQRISSLTEAVGKCGASFGTVRNSSSLPPAEERLAGQVAIITGGAGGIGSRTARLFTQHGARVVIADVRQDEGESLAKELGPKAHFVYCNVTKEEDIIKAWETAYSLENKLDIVFNNAGILGAMSPLQELPIAEYDATMAINVRGVVLGIKHAARLMAPSGKGSIVCTASVAGMAGGLFTFSYSLSKASVVAMVKCAAAELRRFGIRVNSISPDVLPNTMGVGVVEAFAGTVETGGLTVDMVDGIVKQGSLIPGRSITEQDIANAVLYLASDTGGYITGHNLAVDGGRAELNVVNPETASWATTCQPMINVAGQRGLG